MLDKLREGDFYILVPDNETKREVCGFRCLFSSLSACHGLSECGQEGRDADFLSYARSTS